MHAHYLSGNEGVEVASLGGEEPHGYGGIHGAHPDFLYIATLGNADCDGDITYGGHYATTQLGNEILVFRFAPRNLTFGLLLEDGVDLVLVVHQLG